MSVFTQITGQDAARNSSRTGDEIRRLIEEQVQNGRNLWGMGYADLAQVLPILASESLNYNADPMAGGAWMGRLFDKFGANDAAYDSSARELEMDFARRGVPLNTTAYGSPLSGLRSEQAANIAGGRREVIASEAIRREQERYGRLNNLFGLSANTANMGSNLINAGVGGLGGLKGMYDAEASSSLANIGNIASIFTGGLPGFGFDDILEKIGIRKPKSTAGDNTLGTNQSGRRIYSGNPGGAAGSVNPFSFAYRP